MTATGAGEVRLGPRRSEPRWGRADRGTSRHCGAGYPSAAQHADNPAIVTALLEAGADPEARNDKGESVWDVAQGNDALRDTAVHERLRALAGE